jgi:dihydroorotate dehydrogenase electron transfer subunit
MIETIATIASNDEIAPGYRLLVLNFDQSIRVRSGQFAMLKAHTAIEPLLRRALAVYRVYDSRRLGFLYHVLGRGTESLSQLGRGGKINALIPLGNGWLDNIGQNSRGPNEPVNKERAIIVAGGIGSASVLMLCEDLAQDGRETQFFFGAATERAAVGCGLEDFRKLGLPLSIFTDDGSLGERGFVTVGLERHLREGGGTGATIYACGPWVMMKRVAEIAHRFNVACLVSLEAPMGCGFGVCVGCVVAMKAEGPPRYGSYRRVCIDGSVFPAEAILWEVNAMGQ